MGGYEIAVPHQVGVRMYESQEPDQSGFVGQGFIPCRKEAAYGMPPYHKKLEGLDVK